MASCKAFSSRTYIEENKFTDGLINNIWSTYIDPDKVTDKQKIQFVTNMGTNGYTVEKSGETLVVTNKDGNIVQTTRWYDEKPNTVTNL